MRLAFVSRNFCSCADDAARKSVRSKEPPPGAVAKGSGRLVLFQFVEGAVVRQVEQDHVVEVPAMSDVIPADELDPELLVVLLHLAREQGAHEELEERIAPPANREEGRKDWHGLC